MSVAGGALGELLAESGRRRALCELLHGGLLARGKVLLLLLGGFCGKSIRVLVDWRRAVVSFEGEGCEGCEGGSLALGPTYQTADRSGQETSERRRCCRRRRTSD